jgi:hypothetical protein
MRHRRASWEEWQESDSPNKCSFQALPTGLTFGHSIVAPTSGGAILRSMTNDQLIHIDDPGPQVPLEEPSPNAPQEEPPQSPPAPPQEDPTPGEPPRRDPEPRPEPGQPVPRVQDPVPPDVTPRAPVRG